MRPSARNCLPPSAALYFGVFQDHIQEGRYLCRARVLRGREAAERVSFGADFLCASNICLPQSLKIFPACRPSLWNHSNYLCRLSIKRNNFTTYAKPQAPYCCTVCVLLGVKKFFSSKIEAPCTEHVSNGRTSGPDVEDMPGTSTAFEDDCNGCWMPIFITPPHNDTNDFQQHHSSNTRKSLLD